MGGRGSEINQHSALWGQLTGADNDEQKEAKEDGVHARLQALVLRLGEASAAAVDVGVGLLVAETDASWSGHCA